MIRAIFIVTLISLIILSGCKNTSTPAVDDKLSCAYDSDCACGGIDKVTGNCFVGNNDYYEKNVDKEKACPDFCTGIDGNMKTKCIENKCTQIHLRTLNSCETDDECIRENSCCDCGLGTYINKKYLTENNCEIRCMCATVESTGKCIDNHCTAVAANQ